MGCGSEERRKAIKGLLRANNAREVHLRMLLWQVSRAAAFRWQQRGTVTPLVKARDFPLLTARQVADELGIKVGTVYKWAAAGRIGSVRLGRLRRFRQRDLRRAAEDATGGISFDAVSQIGEFEG